MQTLKYQEMSDIAGVQSTKREYPVPDGHKGVDVQVESGKEDVILTIDGKPIALPTEGARTLALALRQSANRVEREIRQRG